MAVYKAIETYYNGFHFRSRLEARWAVFFDHLGIKYLYEPQGFVLGEEKICYLPDFYLPELKTWIEVKGVMTKDDEKKIKYFIEEYLANNNEEKIIILGDIPRQDEIWRFTDNYNISTSLEYGPFSMHSGTISDYSYFPCIAGCGKVDFEFWGKSYRICEECLKNGNCECHGKFGSYDDNRIVNAYSCASSARFDHGQYGT